MAIKENEPMKNDVCLYTLPLSQSKEKLKYLSHYTVYRWAKNKKGYSKAQVKKRLIFCSFLDILIFIYILIFPELFFSNLFGIFVVTFGIFMFILGTQVLNFYYFQCKYSVMFAKIRNPKAGDTVKFYDHYFQIVGLKKFNKVKYSNAHFFIHKNDIYIILSNNNSGFFVIIEASDYPVEFLDFLKEHIKIQLEN